MRLYAVELLAERGEHVDEVAEHPWMAGRLDVILAALPDFGAAADPPVSLEGMPRPDPLSRFRYYLGHALRPAPAGGAVPVQAPGDGGEPGWREAGSIAAPRYAAGGLIRPAPDPGSLDEWAGVIAAALTMMCAGDPAETSREFTRRHTLLARSVAEHNRACARPLPEGLGGCEFCGWRPPGSPACADWHELSGGDSRCARCGEWLTALTRFSSSAVYQLGEGRVLAAACVLHGSEAEGRAFRDWLTRQDPALLDTPSVNVGASMCRRRGHQFGQVSGVPRAALAPEEAVECDRCGLAIEGGDAEQRAYLAAFLNDGPAIPRAFLTAAQPYHHYPLVEGGAQDATDQAAERAAEELARRPHGRFTAGRLRAAIFGEGIEPERLDTEEAIRQDLADMSAAQSATRRRLAPLESLPAETRLTVAAGPGREPEAWRMTAVGVWIARAGEPTVDLTAEGKTAGQLRADLARKRR